MLPVSVCFGIEKPDGSPKIKYHASLNSLGPGNIREGIGARFPARYQYQKLIYYEHYRDIGDAIARESQLKKWSGAKKIALVDRMNPLWLDLGAAVLQDRYR